MDAWERIPSCPLAAAGKIFDILAHSETIFPLEIAFTESQFDVWNNSEVVLTLLTSP